VVDAVFINGTVGVGKTSAGEALSALQADAGQSHAFIDVDTVRRLWPSPVDDRSRARFQCNENMSNPRAGS
jgi:broad-specificity NMP kinase